MTMTKRILQALLETQPARMAAAWVRASIDEEVNTRVNERLRAYQANLRAVAQENGDDKPLLLLAMPTMLDIAKRICAQHPGQIELGNVSMDVFPDDFPDIFIEGAGDFADRNVAVLFDFSDKRLVLDQISVMYTLAAQRPLSLRFIVPYFPTGTMEDVRKEGQVATAWTLAVAISACAPAGPGPIPIYFYDMHALPIRHYFEKTMAPRFKSGVKWLKVLLAEEAAKGRKIAIGLPDMGAAKRYEPWFVKAGAPKGKKADWIYAHAICDKVRLPGKDRIVTMRPGTPRLDGYTVYQIDDLVHGGSTAIEGARAFRDHGAAEVVNFCTHAVMEHDAHLRLADSGAFDRIMITDSIPETVKRIGNNPLFHTITLDTSLGNALLEGLPGLRRMAHMIG